MRGDVGVERREDFSEKEGGGGKQKNGETKGKNDRKRRGDSSLTARATAENRSNPLV